MNVNFGNCRYYNSTVLRQIRSGTHDSLNEYAAQPSSPPLPARIEADQFQTLDQRLQRLEAGMQQLLDRRI